ncbi:MAG: SH3 domain-containing protein [Sumerlaeia bacterium]
MRTLAQFLIALLLLVGMASAARAQDMPIEKANELLNEANTLYTQQSFDQALRSYSRLLDSGWASPALLTNAANAAWRTGQTGPAVLYYERALRLDPGYDPARRNLRYAQPTTNALPANEQTLGDIVSDWFRDTPAAIWWLLMEAAFVALLLALYFTGKTERRTERREVWGGRAIATGVLFAVFGGLLILHGLARQSGPDAIVMAEFAISRTGPGEHFLQQMELPEGTAVELLAEPDQGWVRFKLVDGRSGFVPTAVLERI